MNEAKRIAVIGAGFMGAAIATIYARYGYEVALHDVDQEMLNTYRERALPTAEALVSSTHRVGDIFARVTPQTSLDAAVEGAFLVHEIVQEVLSVKQNLFAALDSICPPDTVLATNTSSYLLSDICEEVTHKSRVIGIHYVTPPHIVRAVEIITSPFTPPALVDWARQFVRSIDHVGVACVERPGFLINRIQFAMLAEVHRIVDEGLATREEVDAAVRLSLGPRLALWGPLLTEDLVASKKTVLAVGTYLHEQTGDPNFAVRSVVRGMVEEGKLGATTGEGWYKFGVDSATIASRRDAQLKELLEWLDRKNPVGEIGVVP